MPLTLLPVTLVMTGALALINLWLTFRVGQARRASGVSVGDGGDDRLIRRMRAQANFIENAPIVIALVGLIELAAGPSIWLEGAAALFVLARIAHPIGMDGTVYRARMIGTTATILLQLALAIWAIAIPLVAHHDAVEAQPVETVVPQG